MLLRHLILMLDFDKEIPESSPVGLCTQIISDHQILILNYLWKGIIGYLVLLIDSQPILSDPL